MSKKAKKPSVIDEMIKDVIIAVEEKVKEVEVEEKIKTLEVDLKEIPKKYWKNYTK